MKRIDRYILGSFFSAWVASFVFFTGMYLVIHFFNKMGDLADAAESFERAGWSPVQGLCLYYALNLPFVMGQTAPYTVLMGAMWAAQQMATKNELVPVLVAGISFRRLATPILVAGFVLALLFAGVREGLLPTIAAERHKVERIYKGKERDVIKRIRLIPGRSGETIHIGEYDVAKRVAYNVDVMLPRDVEGDRVRFAAVSWGADGWEQTDGEPASIEALRATGLRPRDVEIESRGLLVLDVTDLRRLIDRYPDRSDLRLLLHAHFAYPVGVVVLLLLGLPLVLKSTRRTPFVAAGVSLMLSVAFFATQTVLQDLGGRNELLNPVLGAWLPIILFGTVGVLLFETMST
ncbi:MAG: LptF/LptG family permease [Planctomycetes bacterium]|nr:LptF/LptG family permease [Planctomycetota bacterium]